MPKLLRNVAVSLLLLLFAATAEAASPFQRTLDEIFRAYGTVVTGQVQDNGQSISYRFYPGVAAVEEFEQTVERLTGKLCDDPKPTRQNFEPVLKDGLFQFSSVFFETPHGRITINYYTDPESWDGPIEYIVPLVNTVARQNDR